jgi:hypothetical protein
MAGLINTQTTNLDGSGDNAAKLAQVDQTVAGGSAVVQPTVLPMKDQINAAYQTHFGRPADEAGMAYWMNTANQNPNTNIANMIGMGAQQQDQNAQTSINAGGVDTTHTWNPSLNTADVAPQKDTWDATTNTWKAAATPVSSAPTGAALLGDPTKWNITKDQTTQGQMTNLIDPNSPYYQAWKNAGANDAAARGFTGNSSIRDSAIMDSIMRNATPIAQSDAAVYAKAAGYNADEPNQFAMANQNASNNLNLANISASTQKFVAGLSSDTQKIVANLNNTSQQTISAAHDANAVFLANNKAAQDALSQLANGLNVNSSNTALTGGAKETANNNLIDIYNNNPVNLANPNFVKTPYQVYTPENGNGIINQNTGAPVTTPPAVTTPPPATTTTLTPEQQAAKDAADHATAVTTVGGTDVSDQLDFSKEPKKVNGKTV